ncbi:hypothetical protein SAMN05421741_106139 [Paenimyroides ummariense]|uniref:Photosynthesis system II assembly factor Ycf48/Hcf136-like domain-containing protein n=1 Tax=Paenimyroides ummariense TaxID=913024 RepID=A0A1I4ZNR3_9FLAO|nr:hypothetical protein SAMN05421741_106139 [Paenimyroides ummariense]
MEYSSYCKRYYFYALQLYTFDSSNIIKTTDGGQTWNSYIIDSTMYTILHEVEFIDKKTGYIAGGTDYGDWRILLKTENGGQT